MEEFKYENLTIALVDEAEGNYGVIACDKSAKKVHIPLKIDGKKIVYIEENAFEDCSRLEEVTIEEASFEDATVDDLGLKKIGDGAFACCTALKRITLPHTVYWIGHGAFRRCRSLRFADFGAGTTVYDYAFARCEKLESVSPISEAGEGAFCDCIALKSVRFADGCYQIEEEAFARTGLRRVVIPAGVQRIDYLAFRSCQSLSEVIFEEPNGWVASSRYGGEDEEVDFSDPVKNAKLFGFADFDDGPMWFIRRGN